jgi:ssRNA-specific RNase YbeY (16S rRNA maturation enzyme)
MTTEDRHISDQAHGLLHIIGVDRNTHECRREAFETEARRGISQVRPTEAYVQSVEKAGREDRLDPI